MCAFRKRARPCPACESLLRVINIGDDNGVDVCNSCGGAFFEFFDGEPTELARELLEHVQAFSDYDVSQDGGDATCPDCEVAMVTWAYLSGPLVSRCERCLCLFASAVELLALAKAEHEELEGQEPSWLGKVLAALAKRWSAARDSPGS